MASLGRNIIANYIGRSWMAILSIVLIPVYIRFMGIEAYGLVGFFTTLSGVLGILDLGIGQTLNRELARRSIPNELLGSQKDLVRTLEVIYWGIAILAGIIVTILAPFIANTWIKAQGLNSESILKAVQLMGISVALQFPMSLYLGGLMGMQKQVLVNIILIITSTLRGGGAILALWLVSPTIQTFFMWQVFMSLVGSLIFFAAIWTKLPKTDTPTRFRSIIVFDVWRYAAALSVNAIIGIILSQLDKVILSKMLSLKMFAYYSIASTVASAIWMIIIPFNTAIFPSLVQLYERNEIANLRILFHRSSQLLSFILFPACAVLIVFSSQILSIWLHDPSIVKNSHIIVSLLVFGTMLNGIVSLPANSAPAFGWPMLITYTNAIQAVAIIPLIIFLVNWLQGIGAGIAWIIINSTYVFFMAPIFFHRFLKEEKKKWYFLDLLQPALISFSICIISFLIAPEMGKTIMIIIWLLVTGIITLVVTGITLPEVRSIVYERWKILRKI